MQTLNRLISVLDELAAWIDEIKPIAQPMRYGNKAFRSWHARLVKEGERLCKSLLPSGASAPATSAGAASESSVSTAAGGAGDGGSAEAAPAAESATARCAGAEVELLAYLLDSFGNATRIDYGTGHESTFMILVCECEWYCRTKSRLAIHSCIVSSDSIVGAMPPSIRLLCLVCVPCRLSRKARPCRSCRPNCRRHQGLPSLYVAGSQAAAHLLAR